MHFVLSGSQESPNTVYTTLTHLSVAWSPCTCLVFKPTGGPESCLVHCSPKLLPKAPEELTQRFDYPYPCFSVPSCSCDFHLSIIDPDILFTEWDCCVLPVLNFSPRGQWKSPQAGILSEYAFTIMYFPSLRIIVSALKFPSFTVVSRRRRGLSTHHSILEGVRIPAESTLVISVTITSLFPFIYVLKYFNIIYSSVILLYG